MKLTRCLSTAGLFVALTGAVHAQPDPFVCGNAPAPQLVIGGQGQVTPGGANNLRLQPGTSAERIGVMPAGGTFVVLDGPVCAGDLVWWQVRFVDGTGAALEGWTIESLDGAYVLEPVPAQNSDAPAPEAAETAVPEPDFAGGSCEGLPAPRLTVNGSGSVIAGGANNVRSTPSTQGERVAVLEGGSAFYVLDGPVCADGLVWWQVEYTDDAGDFASGWTVEGLDGTYLLQPAERPITPVVLSDGGTTTVSASTDLMTVTFSLPDEFVGGEVEAIELFPFFDAAGPYFSAHPAGIQIRLPGIYGTDFTASLNVFDVYTVGDAGVTFAERYAELLAFIDQPPPFQDFLDLSDRAELPMLPPANSAQVMTALPQRIDTDDGAGWRAITAYAQEVTPLYGFVLYEYAGLASGAERIVTLQIPASAPLLDELAAGIPDIFRLQSDFAAYQDYYLETVSALNDAPETIEPPLDVLDGIVQSIVVGDPE